MSPNGWKVWGLRIWGEGGLVEAKSSGGPPRSHTKSTANTKPHPPPHLSIPLPGRRGVSQRIERGKGRTEFQTSRPLPLQPRRGGGEGGSGGGGSGIRALRIRDLALGSESFWERNGDLQQGARMGTWGRRLGQEEMGPALGRVGRVEGALTVAVLKQRGRVIEAAEGRAALRHRPATATAGAPGPSPGPVPTPGPASRCHSNTLRSSIPGTARPASGGRRRAWHRGHPSGCPESGGGGCRDTPC